MDLNDIFASYFKKESLFVSMSGYSKIILSPFPYYSSNYKAIIRFLKTKNDYGMINVIGFNYYVSDLSKKAEFCCIKRSKEILINLSLHSCCNQISTGYSKNVSKTIKNIF